MKNFFTRTYEDKNTHITTFKIANSIIFFNLNVGHVKIILNQKVETPFKEFQFKLLKRKNKNLIFPSMVRASSVEETKKLFVSYMKQLSNYSLSQDEILKIFEECLLPEISTCQNFMFATYFNPKNGGETASSTYLFTLN